jgi:phospholysine phosphohistidine inorganic pyrophosphate phosphatase
MTDALDGVEALLLDLSGVVYVQDEAVPGAAEALSALRERDVPLRLVTNTTMRPRRSILERLERLGIEADPSELITPATLAARRCEERGY